MLTKLLGDVIKRAFCSHKNLQFVRNIHGDEILHVSPINKIYRSQHICEDCGKLVFKEYLLYEKNGELKKDTTTTLEDLIKESHKRANESWNEFGCYHRNVAYALEKLKEVAPKYERVNPHIK